ncbi:cyclase family protein [Micromonospora sp. NPDC005206]|uniref:cyclase family protein n=1 Tax=Micromonospora sp. NPDC005206 TaxID=3157022 RepID=UPI0033ABA963
MPNRFLSVLADGAEYVDLSHPLESSIPTSPNHVGFKLALQRRHGDVVRPDGSSGASEVIITGGHIGTHIDALSHISFQGLLHGGVDAAAAQRSGRFEALGAETIAPFFCRGILLDVAKHLGEDVLVGGYEITAEDLAGSAKRAGVEIRRGDVVLIRTGWAQYWSRAEQYLGLDSGVPGIGPTAAEWLAARGPRAVGGDTTAVECLPPGQGTRLLPVHKLLIVDNGIHLIEHVNLEPLRDKDRNEFLFVLIPLRIVGATGSPVRPLAVY